MSHFTKLFPVSTSVLVAFLAAAIPARAAEHQVDQHDMTFVPAALTIKAGDSVRFTDTDHITHNVLIVYPDGTSQDKGMSTYQQNITVTFDKPGIYQVRCRIHPNMNMTITVQ